MNAFKNFFRQGFSKRALQCTFGDMTKVFMLSSFFLVNKCYQDYKKSYRCTSEAISSQISKEFLSQFIDNVYKKSHDRMIILSGNGNKQLANKIAENLEIDLSKSFVGKFPDGEIKIQIDSSIRGKDIYIIQSIQDPVNDNLVELLLMISACKRASARTITAIIPYYGYARQDRKVSPRVPISAADVAKLYEAMGVDRVVSIDLHCSQIQGFFSPRIPVDNIESYQIAKLYFQHYYDDYILQQNLDRDKHKKGGERIYQDGDFVVVSPDAGGVARAKKFQQLINYKQANKNQIAIIIKERNYNLNGQIQKMSLVGQVKGKNCIIYDDMIDTAGTVGEAAKLLKEYGAKDIYVFATHGVFSGPAFQNIENSGIKKVIVTNTIQRKEQTITDKIVTLDISPILTLCIKRIQTNQSISSMFEQGYVSVE